VVESERTDSLNMQAEALCDLGEVLAAADRPLWPAASASGSSSYARRATRAVSIRSPAGVEGAGARSYPGRGIRTAPTTTAKMSQGPEAQAAFALPVASASTFS
jgi:hypothetical protein